jgi:hypothetical protein
VLSLKKSQQGPVAGKKGSLRHFDWMERANAVALCDMAKDEHVTESLRAGRYWTLGITISLCSVVAIFYIYS